MKEHAETLRTVARNMSVFDHQAELAAKLSAIADAIDAPVPMILYCPQCRSRHVDAGEFATKSHHTHACQVCGHVWRPAVVATTGVAFLPGFKDDEPGAFAAAADALRAVAKDNDEDACLYAASLLENMS